MEMNYCLILGSIPKPKIMKSLSTILLLLVSALTFGQSPYSIVDTNKTWNTMHAGTGSWMVNFCGGTRTHIFQGEVIYGQHTYHYLMESEDSLLLQWNSVGCMREDTLSQCVYYLIEDTMQIILYAFNIGIGDTIFSPFSTSPYYEETYLVCLDKDTVYVEGQLRIRFVVTHYINDECTYGDTYLDGIGSIYGPFYQGSAPGGYQTLLCCSDEETLIYKNARFDTCHLDEFYPQIANEYFDTAYLNTNYEFQVDLIGANWVDSFNLINS
jgi:hypothetical protein